ncbi:BST1 [Candida margitis]|uniref:BST1 n=1 Tax=Candida margitis TaxID=1775924 RepID=UPI0022266874|nr:BST1 [Candida margitis]KAI5969041.1 BST1 [Candida margitis]
MRPNTQRINTLPFYISLLLGGLLILFTLKSYTSKLNGPDKPSCRVVWMYPSYIKINSFDQSHTKYASKYSTYLYREQGRDKLPSDEGDNDAVSSMELEGVPVLFIPGNAGNHRQARSIAARTSELYYEMNDSGGREGRRSFKTRLDFFTLDFNEDFTAFHGRTILDQAEYANEAVKFILDLYSNRPHPPKSVIVVGHSMGGIVARIMMTLPDYLPNSIENIITLSSPHSTSPLTFDGDLSTVYSAVDKFWYCGFTNCSSSSSSSSKSNQLARVAHDRLHNVALISITGGALDSTLPADYTTLGYLVPKTNGFTSFSTGMPQVWTPIDHLAIVWCQQLRTRIALALLELTSLADGENTLRDRMRVYERYFLTGFEDYVTEDKRLPVVSKEDAFGGEMGQMNNKLEEDVIYTGKQLGSRNLLTLDKDKDYQFTLLSSVPLQSLTQDHQDPQLSVGLFNKEGDGAVKDVSSLQATIPNFSKDASDVSDSSYDGPKQPYYSLVLNSTMLKQYSSILLTLPQYQQSSDIYCQLSTKRTHYSLNKGGNGVLSWFKFFTKGHSISLPSNRLLLTNFKIPQAWSSLYVYKLKLTSGGYNQNLNGHYFNTFIRQWTEDPFESKWFINVGKDKKEDSLQLTMHGISPFVPYKTQSDYGLNLQMWSSGDGSGSGKIKGKMRRLPVIDINVSIDVGASLKLLILRYRITIVAMNIAIICLVLVVQFGQYGNGSKTGKSFPSFDQSLIYLNARYWWVIVLGLILANYVINIPIVNKVLHYVDPVVLQDYNKFLITNNEGDGNESQFRSNGLYLGLTQSISIIGVLLYLCCNFAIWITYIILIAMGTVINYGVRLYPTRFRVKSTRTRSMLVKVQLYFMVVVVLLIPVYLPYQIVYLICCIHQVINVLKDWPLSRRRGKGGDKIAAAATTTNTSVTSGEEEDEIRAVSLLNYQASWLMLMLWILPINVPILIVFIHNLQLSWQTPFSSHHNLLSILPILLMTYYNSHNQNKKKKGSNGGGDASGGGGCILPRLSYNSTRLVQIGVGYIAIYSLWYGSRHTFYIHHLFNLLCCLIWIVFYSSGGGNSNSTGGYINNGEDGGGGGGGFKEDGLGLKLS